MAAPPEPETALTFVVPHRIGVLAAEPYLRQVLRRGAETFVVCPTPIIGQLVQAVPAVEDRVIPLEELEDRRHRRLHRLHGRLTLLLEGQGLYHNPRIAAHLATDRHRSWRLRLGAGLGRLVPKLPAKRLNRVLDRLFGLLSPNPFPTRRVVVVTHATRPHMLCARGVEPIALIESWDHPIKKSAGFRSRAVVAWNQDLGEDWRSFQGADEVWTGYPVKLGYALESELSPAPRGDRPTLLYAVGTTALRPDWYADELRLIAEICAATRDAGWRLLIKPKPNGEQPGLTEMAAEQEHVEVGCFSDGGAGGLDYYLDAGYNARRLAELAGCQLVLNAVTTFCLDAAAAGWPVLQLDLTYSDEYPALARAMGNYHLRRYVVDQPDLCLRGDGEVRRALRDFLQDPDDRPDRFGAKLRHWLTTDATAEAAVERVVDRLLDDSDQAFL